MIAGKIRLDVPLHDRGPALWPEHIDEAMLDGLHRGLGTPLFETMYQSREGGLAGQIIKRSFFRYYAKLPGKHVTYAAVDPAISTKTTADETAIAVGSVSEDGELFIRFVWAGRVGLAAEATAIESVWRYYKPVAIGIEDIAFQAAVITYVQERHPMLPLEPVNPGGRDKLTRHLGLAALYEFGRVYHHPSLENSAFELQLTKLPNGRHDDMADAATYLTAMGGIAGGAQALTRRPEGFR